MACQELVDTTSMFLRKACGISEEAAFDLSSKVNIEGCKMVNKNLKLECE